MSPTKLLSPSRSRNCAFAPSAICAGARNNTPDTLISSTVTVDHSGRFTSVPSTGGTRGHCRRSFSTGRGAGRPARHDVVYRLRPVGPCQPDQIPSGASPAAVFLGVPNFGFHLALAALKQQSAAESAAGRQRNHRFHQRATRTQIPDLMAMPRFKGAWERADQLEPVLDPSISANAFLHDAPPDARRTAVAANGIAKKSPERKITVCPTDPAIWPDCLSATRISLPILADKSLPIERVIVTVILPTLACLGSPIRTADPAAYEDATRVPDNA